MVVENNGKPCKHATDYEIERGLHMTWNEDGICNQCSSLLDLFTMKRANAEAQEQAERGTVVDIRSAARERHPSNSKRED
jgi:hypothetical protein